MSMPVIPQKCRYEVVNDILQSIALEEVSIAHIMNAEGEKIQKLVQCDFPNPDDFNQVLEFQESLVRLFDKLIQKQDILVTKMKLASELEHHKYNNCKDKPICSNE